MLHVLEQVKINAMVKGDAIVLSAESLSETRPVGVGFRDTQCNEMGQRSDTGSGRGSKMAVSTL